MKIEKSEDYITKGFDSIESYHFPPIVNLNVLSGECICNCVHCPVGRVPAKDRKKRFRYSQQDLDLFKRIVDEIKATGNTGLLRIHAVGEPILWKHLIEASEYACTQNVRTWLFTCGITKDKNFLKTLCENINIIEISVNSIDSKDYKKTKGTDGFNLVAENIAFMHSFIKRYKLPARLIVSRVQSYDKKLDGRFVEFWKSSGNVHDAFVRSYHSYNDQIKGSERSEAEIKKDPCLVHWARCNINLDGNVVVCFNELFRKKIDPDNILGNLRENTIADIWQGEKLRAIRNAELYGDYSGIKSGFKLPCENCAYCQPLHGGNRQTSEYQIKKISAGEL
ncbi:SPASM domain-containing protein [Desulfobacula phenolica]|uniref:Radical SAM superfamily enzyme, MoaA/NifB/PqqE/SkfB family n=1 Tax=Desulfobacula phenolica TaxID=90732 RepID=A0A1H2K821_9BACT|nr:SPASM domain-containing protein [Desulfobacula phenolica]SDU64880.1 Radical SAM superfamily enzyme, MoaA/NifB/PqqE/SkfB family [Desulfobacula phenolica]